MFFHCIFTLFNFISQYLLMTVTLQDVFCDDALLFITFFNQKSFIFSFVLYPCWQWQIWILLFLAALIIVYFFNKAVFCVNNFLEQVRIHILVIHILGYSKHLLAFIMQVLFSLYQRIIFEICHVIEVEIWQLII